MSALPPLVPLGPAPTPVHPLVLTPGFTTITPPSMRHLVPVMPLPGPVGPRGADGESAAADIDPVLLFDNALA